MPTAIRLATSPWFAPRLDGHSLRHALGPVQLRLERRRTTRSRLAARPAAPNVPALGATRSGSSACASRCGATATCSTAARSAPASGHGHRRRRCCAPLGRPPVAEGAAARHRRRRRADRAAGTRCSRPTCPSCSAPASAARWPCARSSRLPAASFSRAAAHLAVHRRGPGHRGHARRAQQLRRAGPAGRRQLAGARRDRGRRPALLPAPGLRPGRARRRLRWPTRRPAQVERGGSTLTQQLAKLLVTGSERSAERKLRELLYAVEMEQTLGKARILQLYLDNAPWGAGHLLCGAEAAARRYFKRRRATSSRPRPSGWPRC